MPGVEKVLEKEQKNGIIRYHTMDNCIFTADVCYRARNKEKCERRGYYDRKNFFPEKSPASAG